MWQGVIPYYYIIRGNLLSSLGANKIKYIKPMHN